jgi:GST-like protein
MVDLASFPIVRKWPAKYPDRIQLYSVTSPNGVKASVMLEETGLPYEAHLVRFETRDQYTPEFASLNPYNKIPAIIDPHGPGDAPLPLFESGAILLYLAEKCGRFLPQDAAQRYETIQWLMFQVGGVGPMFGQVGYFYKFDGRDFEDKRPLKHYVDEARRVLTVLNQRLESRAWMMGDEYTIADIAIFPMVRNLVGYYRAGDLVGIDDFPNVTRTLGTFTARPAVIRGVDSPRG